MNSISFDEMFNVISSLPDGKTAVVLDMLLVLLNFCLVCELVPGPWRKAWVLMIPKPYKWEGVLINTYPIVLIETACKILSKILLDRISSACSKFNGTTTQSPIFAIGFVVKNALEKNRELWLVLQDMCKAYDLRSLIRIKMCNRFIRFFGSIHNNCRNRVITDFGLTSKYVVCDSLDQGEVFSPLFWHIFYDSLMCEVKRQGKVCGYRLNLHFVSNTGHVKSQTGLILFFAASAFVDDTIWVGSSQAATQHILDIASEFFRINNISINNDKTVIISINCWVETSYLTVSSLPISIAKKSEPHRYLGIFLFYNGLLVPSLAKAYSDIRFFVNLVLKKAILDKQFSYLVSVVLFPIISYRTQFSFDTLICKGLKSKSGLLLDFPNDAFHHPSLYGLKTFEQIQAESKLASIIAFANSVLSWCPYHSLLFPVCVSISSLNNFLAGVVHIFSRCDLSLSRSLACAFCHRDGTFMSFVLGKINFLKCISSLKQYGIAFVKQLHDRNGVVFSWQTFKCWKRLDFCGPIPFWFDLSACFLGGFASFPVCSSLVENSTLSDVHQFHNFGVICNNLLATDAVHLSVYMDGSLNGLNTVAMKAGAAVFFKDINFGLGVEVSGLVFSTLSELQAIALALECVPSSCVVDLFSDSQVALDAYKSELLLAYPDFRNCCWIECHHIANVGHSDISGNKHVDELAKKVVLFTWHLSYLVSKRFLRAGGNVVSGNSRHFVCDVTRQNWRYYLA
ncbi:hypothetical protein G9A89_019004 [Geosiphon pyriformis]|nr:hypothetical protein G9A89_019004 [Geosiphon pyriformis]